MRHETPHLLKTKEDKTVSYNPIVLKSNRLSDEWNCPVDPRGGKSGPPSAGKDLSAYSADRF